MRIKIPCAAPVEYNPAHYLKKAFRQLGHDAEVLTQSELYDLRPSDADLWIGADSGGPLDIPGDFMSRFAMWFIDSRRNCDPAHRQPDDDTFGKRIIMGGGLVFQAQLPDVYRLSDKLRQYLKTKTMPRVAWLPLAADPDVWSDEPRIDDPTWAMAFVGNSFDIERHNALHNLQDEALLNWPGIEGAIMERGAAVYRDANAGLNIPSWWGTPECYDINMRVFEIMSCGKPLITNRLDTLKSLGILEGKHAFLYSSLEEIPHLAMMILQDTAKRLTIGNNNRRLIIEHHTYLHRARKIIQYCDHYMKLPERERK